MSRITAVVVGVCAHGLAICRSLHSARISVIALEANRNLPGVHTNAARVCFVDDINRQGLVPALLNIAKSHFANDKPVLFLTNDTMVRTVAQHYEAISERYRLSWGHCRDSVVKLLDKKGIYERCQTVPLSHPASCFINTRKDLEVVSNQLSYPVIFKPNTPVSSYKTLVVESASDESKTWKTIKDSLPSIAQEYIAGDDDRIYFAAFYFDHGTVVTHFEGRKLRSRPLGHTSVAISESNSEVKEFAERFFHGLQLSGPASLEIKKDPQGQFWVIEPTVGRTDFWLGLCVNDGVNLPLIEYEQEIQGKSRVAAQQDSSLWINGERDPFALLWLLIKFPRQLLRRKLSGVYVNLRDGRPFLRWIRNRLASIPLRLRNKLARLFPPARSS